MFEVFLSGLSFAFNPTALLANFIGVAMGIAFGVLPGLTATMGIALLIPLTFGMPPVVGFGALLGIYVGGVYGGSLTAILVSTPGSPAAAAALLEGPALTEKGQSGKALSMTTIASFIGGVFSCTILILIAPQLAKVAMAFGPPEYFAISLFGLSIVAGISSGSVLKGSIAALLGLALSTIGTDPITGATRFTFGISALISGISFVPALVGLFAISQVFIKLEDYMQFDKISMKVSNEGVTLSELKENAINILRSSIIGTIVGIIPATGSGTASYVAYNESKRASKHPEKFGTGHLEGMAATETANNAVTGGALVPLLTLGIPGDIATAIILGGLMIQGLTPGPLLFKNHPDIITGFFIALILANVFMLILGLGTIKIVAKILSIPQGILMPVIVVLCLLGSYSINNSSFDVIIMMVFGILGYVMTKTGFPLPPLLLALILSPLVESNFRRSMIMSGIDITIFVTRPVSLIVLVVTFAIVGKTIYDGYRSNKI